MLIVMRRSGLLPALVALVLTLVLTGCVTVPPPEPPLVSVTASSVVADGREVPLRLLHAPAVRQRGIIVLSHGTFSSGEEYDAAARPWARAGYVVILPNHRDANFGEVPKGFAQMMEIVDSRANELLVIGDSAAQLVAALDGVTSNPESLPLIAAGHSLGTEAVLRVNGLRLRNPADGSISEVEARGYRGAILLSDPGKMAAMPGGVWRGGTEPVFLVTGPEDYGLMGDGRRDLGFENEVLTPPGDGSVPQYLLSIDGLDHQFGGLIHKTVDAEPDTAAMDWFVELSLAFLSECVTGERAAVSLQPRRVSERATLERFGPACI